MYQPQLKRTDFRSFAPAAGVYVGPPRPRPPPPACSLRRSWGLRTVRTGATPLPKTAVVCRLREPPRLRFASK